MTFEELKEEKSFLSLKRDSFRFKESQDAFSELYDFINFFLGTLWFTMALEHNDISAFPENAPFGVGVTNLALDPHMALGVGVSRGELRARYLVSQRMASPSALSGIVAIVEMYLKHFLPGKLSKEQQSERDSALQKLAKDRQVNNFD
jgi:hypothetical protein